MSEFQLKMPRSANHGGDSDVVQAGLTRQVLLERSPLSRRTQGRCSAWRLATVMGGACLWTIMDGTSLLRPVQAFSGLSTTSKFQIHVSEAMLQQRMTQEMLYPDDSLVAQYSITRFLNLSLKKRATHIRMPCSGHHPTVVRFNSNCTIMMGMLARILWIVLRDIRHGPLMVQRGSSMPGSRPLS
jgi:hypothetical protein